MNLIKTKLASVLKLNALVGVALCSLTACNSGTSGSGSSSNTTGTTQAKSKVSSAPLGDSLYLMQMGSGYDSVSHTVTSGQPCLVNASNQDNILIANPSALVNFDSTTTMDQLQSALNVDVKGKYGGDRFGVSLSAQFANASKSTSYTTNLLYLYEYAGKSIFRAGSLGEGFDALTPYAAEIEQTSPTDFRTMCGDEFVEQMDAGSVLGVRISLNFNSHSDQEQFIGQLDTTVGLTNVSAAIQQAASSSNVHVEMTLSAIQQGGQPEKLNQVFGEPDSSGNYPFLECGSVSGEAGSDACDMMISNIVTYALTMETQLTNEDGTINLDRLYYTNPAVTPYSHLGITGQGAADPSAEILDAMQQLTSDYDKAVYDYNFTSHYLTVLSDKLDNSTRSNLEDATQRLYSQIHDVYLLPVYDVADCYKGYVSTQCLEIQANVEDALVPFALNSTESGLIDYLENNSYSSGGILTYYGGATPQASDYRMNTKCTFAPVSNSSKAYYAMNCDGKWLDTAIPNGVTLEQVSGFGPATVNVANLSYISTPPNSTTNGQLITYTDLAVPGTIEDPRDFFAPSVTIYAPGFSTSNATLDLFQEYENKA